MMQSELRNRQNLHVKQERRYGIMKRIDLKYSLVIEATEDPNFFGFYSPELGGSRGSDIP